MNISKMSLNFPPDSATLKGYPLEGDQKCQQMPLKMEAEDAEMYYPILLNKIVENNNNDNPHYAPRPPHYFEADTSNSSDDDYDSETDSDDDRNSYTDDSNSNEFTSPNEKIFFNNYSINNCPPSFKSNDRSIVQSNDRPPVLISPNNRSPMFNNAVYMSPNSLQNQSIILKKNTNIMRVAKSEAFQNESLVSTRETFTFLHVIFS